MSVPQAAFFPPPQVISDKNWWATLLLCFFVGIFGAHRFYTGKTGTGVLWLFTLGCFGYGWIIDMILILIGKFKDNQGLRIARP
jgi:TM2 domain-containing membrane protein YozV